MTQQIYIDATNPDNFITARHAKDLVRRLAAGFRKAGLKPGDCVCMHAFNSIFYPMAFLGVVAAGGVFAGTNPAYTPYEIAHAIRTAKITHFISEPGLVSNVLAAAEQTGLATEHIFLFNISGEPVPAELAAQGLRSWDWLQQHGAEDWLRFDDEQTSRRTMAARLFSSGTTGMPKALDMSHYNFVAQHTLVMEHRPRPYEVRRLISNPMFHVSQIPRVHTSPFRGGITTVIMRRFELEPWLEYVEKFGITEMNIVPQMVIVILNSGRASKEAFQSLRNAWSGSAPLDVSLQKRFKEYLRDDTPFNQVWGMSETSCIGAWLYYPEYDPTGSCGRPLPNLDIKLVDDAGKDITDYNVRGELCIRGPTIINGYFNNPEASQRDWDDEGYFHTGDVAYCSPERKLWYIVDRKKVCFFEDTGLDIDSRRN